MAKRKLKGGCFLILLLLLGGAWVARDTIAGLLRSAEFGFDSVPSERLADAAEDRIERLVRNGLSRPVRFSEAELQSLLTYRATPFLPAGIEHPRIAVQDSVIVLSAHVRPAEMTNATAPDVVQAMLADSSWVTVVLVPSIDRPGRLSVDVQSLQIGDLIVPSFLLPMIIEGLVTEGFQTSGSVIFAPLPDEVASVRIEDDDFVLEPVIYAD
ncbi:MAG: hypothetical protein E4H28_01940 [Gemmatimonadales bacterium]|nr:MAG: hypothetical protein E4H28_01940 [Gemmatimonadales bacterium]